MSIPRSSNYIARLEASTSTFAWKTISSSHEPSSWKECEFVFLPICRCLVSSQPRCRWLNSCLRRFDYSVLLRGVMSAMAVLQKVSSRPGNWMGTLRSCTKCDRPSSEMMVSSVVTSRRLATALSSKPAATFVFVRAKAGTANHNSKPQVAAIPRLRGSCSESASAPY